MGNFRGVILLLTLCFVSGVRANAQGAECKECVVDSGGFSQCVTTPTNTGWLHCTTEPSWGYCIVSGPCAPQFLASTSFDASGEISKYVRLAASRRATASGAGHLIKSSCPRLVAPKHTPAVLGTLMRKRVATIVL
jgi:hypothetical protein